MKIYVCVRVDLKNVFVEFHTRIFPSNFGFISLMDQSESKSFKTITFHRVNYHKRDAACGASKHMQNPSLNVTIRLFSNFKFKNEPKTF